MAARWNALAWSVHDTLRSGDVLAVWRLDRLGRSLRHLIELMGELEAERIGFKSVTGAVDTTTPGSKLVFHTFGALAEFERNLIRERPYAGLAAARARGRRGGRRKKLGEKQRAVAVDLYRQGCAPAIQTSRSPAHARGLGTGGRRTSGRSSAVQSRSLIRIVPFEQGIGMCPDHGLGQGDEVANQR